MPKHSKAAKILRRAFTSPPGYKVAGLDYSQGELRIVACVAEEPTMIEAYRQGQDLHSVTASNMLGLSLEEFKALGKTDPVKFEAARRNGKAGNFGLLYGMGPEGYVDYAWNLYGVTLSVAEAKKQRAAFFKTYPRLLDYHTEMTRCAREDGYVTSPLGRRRHVPHIHSDDQYQSGKARRQAINSPIQSTLSDMSLWAIARLATHCPEIWVCGMIHDQTLAYVREDKWVEETSMIREMMQELPFEDAFGWQPALSFPTDLEVGPSLGELEKVD